MAVEEKRRVIKLNLTPVNAHILVELPKENNTVYIPKTVSDSQQEGVVAELPADGLLFPLKQGDRIRWEKYAEADGSFQIDGKTYCLVKSAQVMGVYQEIEKTGELA